LKTGSIIIPDILNNEPEEFMGAIYKNLFSEAKEKLKR